MPEWQWLPVPWGHFFEPYLASLTPQGRERVEAGLEMVRKDPRNPEHTYPWKGRGGLVQVPQTTRMAIIEGPRPGEFVQVIYAPFVDYPLLGAIGIFPLDPPSAGEGNGEDF